MKQTQIVAELKKRNLKTNGRRVVQLERLADALMPPGTKRPRNRTEYRTELKKRGINSNRNRFVLLELLVTDLIKKAPAKREEPKPKGKGAPPPQQSSGGGCTIS